VDVPAMRDHLHRTARRLNLPFGDRRMTFNSRRAQELGKWAEAQGRGEAFHRAVFQAYFAEGLNIADLTVLASIVEKIGLPDRQAMESLAAGTYRDAVDRDWQRSRARGISDVPTFEYKNRQLVGAQSYDALVDLIGA
jgi:predicted DsbA family dithiol-disulfide isomerase